MANQYPFISETVVKTEHDIIRHLLSGHPWGMSNCLLITTSPINIGLTNLGVYQENEDGDKAKSLMSRFARSSKNCDFSCVAKNLRACLHGGGVPQIGEVTRLGGVARLSI